MSRVDFVAAGGRGRREETSRGIRAPPPSPSPATPARPPFEIQISRFTRPNGILPSSCPASTCPGVYAPQSESRSIRSASREAKEEEEEEQGG